MSHRKTLAERLADISSDVRSAEIDPEAPVFDDGTGAGEVNVAFNQHLCMVYHF